MAEELGRERLEELLAALAERLDGDWLLLGGALVALWLEPRRVTEDIDLVSLAGLPEQRFQLTELAATAGLSIEAVNSAADLLRPPRPGLAARDRDLSDWSQGTDLSPQSDALPCSSRSGASQIKISPTAWR